MIFSRRDVLILKIRIQPDCFPRFPFPVGCLRMRVSILVYTEIRCAQACFGIGLDVQKNPVVLPLCMAIEEYDFKYPVSVNRCVRPYILYLFTGESAFERYRPIAD